MFNRSRATAQAVVDSFPQSYGITIIDKFDDMSTLPSIVVSTVPASATTTDKTREGLHLPPSILDAPRGGVVADLAYKPHTTPLLALAGSHPNAKLWKPVRGVECLIEQGCRQFELWTGRRAPVTIIREAVLGAYDA